MKKVIIMGATSGIGLQVAERLARKGHRVGVAGRNTGVLKQLKKAYPDAIEWEAIDITDENAPKRLHELIKRLGGMDTYFHVSGIGFENGNLDPARNLSTVQTNVAGFVRMVDCAFAYFRDHRQPGQIAAVTSVAGTRGIGMLAAYSASKRFCQTYLEALDQLARNRHLPIKITDIRPGWIRTPLLNPDQEYPLTMTLDHATPRIISGLCRPFRINYVDWRWALVAMAMKMVPPCLWVRLNIPVYTKATPMQAIDNEARTIAATRVTKPKK